MAHTAYGLGHGSPGHVSTCSPGQLLPEAGRAQEEAGPVALGAAPASSGSCGHGAQERALHLLHAVRHLF